jgi:hypothetical protein
MNLENGDKINLIKFGSEFYYINGAGNFAIFSSISALSRRTQTTGVSINFAAERVYNTATTPGTGNVSFSQTGAMLGVVQKIYHNDGTPPSFSGVSDIQIMGTGTYTESVINVIYAEWTETDRVEYWITQEG